jgi:hypothetical protein
VADSYSNTISVLLGNGDGTFQPRTPYTVGATPRGVAVRDLSGDAKLDVVVAGNAGGPNVSVLLGNGDGTLGSPSTYGAGVNSSWVAAGDVNRDQKADLAVTNDGSDTVSVLRGNGNGTFAPKTDYGTGSSPYFVAIRDLDSDGAADLAIPNQSSDSVSVLPGNGDGTFQAKVDFPAGNGALHAAVRDLNGDGRPDLAVADSFSSPGVVSVLLNTTPPNRPPNCSGVRATPSMLLASGGAFRLVALSGATDPDGDPVTLTINGVTQDEPVPGPPSSTFPDAMGSSESNQVYLRAERRGDGDGRVYRIAFKASDGRLTCSGTTTVRVPLTFDSAPPSYNSFGR